MVHVLQSSKRTLFFYASIRWKQNTVNNALAPQSPLDSIIWPTLIHLDNQRLIIGLYELLLLTIMFLQSVVGLLITRRQSSLMLIIDNGQQHKAEARLFMTYSFVSPDRVNFLKLNSYTSLSIPSWHISCWCSFRGRLLLLVWRSITLLWATSRYCSI